MLNEDVPLNAILCLGSPILGNYEPECWLPDEFQVLFNVVFLKWVAMTSIQAILNSCLTRGFVPASFKQAVVQSLLKKHNLDAKCQRNYRPISKWPFIWKILEKVVLSQLLPFLNHAEILEPFQSGFRSRHSTETALLKVTNDLLLTLDSWENAILILVDLSAAFDTGCRSSGLVLVAAVGWY